ncbi:cell division protein FtsW [Tessaracoccus lapidicaptus]|uniref:Probable peptidoglycan glycosyltransferase FtsW n=1 Tax=Tessaracoccus lapidicaptus TaxID=1427523 RepID=A0A1C0AI08_9ACTN|nr:MULTISPECIES: putative lipid II flippase FtsW [Tessaracoccus]AQX16716.1 putative lipid II flippase FtsW [Tessaracoccus sp. T2.5-30]OCL31695.1 cell division protein FtsW [Tessaracoccus lapidicaptus]VEP41465.1 putative peptidoglycan glycosyltransferase FtsW [Tessaracoccus lapidicaptus]
MASDAASPARPISLWSQVRALAASPMAPFYFIVASVAALVGVGSLMVLSASSVIAQAEEGDPYYYTIRQLQFLGIGLLSAFVLMRIKPDVLRRMGWLVWALAVTLLIAVLTPLGVVINGNRNWLVIGGFQFQPSEFAKLALIVWCGALFHIKRSRLHEPIQIAIPFVPLGGLILALVLAGKDLGTGLIIGLIMVLVLFFVGTSMRILAPLGAAALGLVILLVYGSGNRMSRIQIFLDPSSNSDLSSQPMAALYALASGGWWGLGLGASKQKWGGLKTGAHTDYIFAVIGEELGLFGVLLIIALFALLGWAGLETAMRADTMFNRVVAAGITGWFLVQAVINIFVVLHLLPVLGVPLPFVSYGGSALLASLMAAGVLLAIARDTPEARAHLAARRRTGRPRMTSVMAATKED